jgi:hypothetical protein
MDYTATIVTGLSNALREAVKVTYVPVQRWSTDTHDVVVTDVIATMLDGSELRYPGPTFRTHINP